MDSRSNQKQGARSFSSTERLQRQEAQRPSLTEPLLRQEAWSPSPTEPLQRQEIRKPSPADRLQSHRLKSTLIQAAVTFLTNAHLTGFFTGNIYQGPLKKICVPGLNCYSCPGALGACPLGSLQSALFDANQLFPFYVLGFLVLTGSLLGRAVCAFLCPFGFIQDLLARITKKKARPERRFPRLDRGARAIKFVNLFLLVLFLPLMGRWFSGLASPWFCKLVCPAGTIEAGWFLTLLDPQLRRLIGWLFGWKTLLAIAVITACIFIPRFFCRYFCPLGAFYALFNRFALTRLRFDKAACIHCGRCEQVCPMGLAMPEVHESLECIRCGRCAAACPCSCLSCGVKKLTPSEAAALARAYAQQGKGLASPEVQGVDPGSLS